MDDIDVLKTLQRLSSHDPNTTTKIKVLLYLREQRHAPVSELVDVTGKGQITISRCLGDLGNLPLMQEAVRDALIAFMAATAQAQAEATKKAQKAGIAANKGDPRKYRGKKPSYDRETLQIVLDSVGRGDGDTVIARATGLSRQTVIRIRTDGGRQAEEALARWDM